MQLSTISVSGCTPSQMIKAFGATCSTIPTTGWEMLNIVDPEFLALRQRRHRSYSQQCDEYQSLQKRLEELLRLAKVLEPLSKTQTEVPEVGRALKFANAELRACRGKMDLLERDATPVSLAAFFTSQLEKCGATGTLIPGADIEIRFSNGSRLELFRFPFQIQLKQRLRRATYTIACNFLKDLKNQAEDADCTVTREGTGTVIEHTKGFITSGKPEPCLAVLVSRKGRRIAHEQFPPFNSAGDMIPS